MFIHIEKTDNGYIVRATPEGQYDHQEVRVYEKLSAALKWVKELLEPEQKSE